MVVKWIKIIFVALLTQEFRLWMKWKFVIVGVSKKQCGHENVFFKTKFLTILFLKWLIQEIFIYYEIKIWDNGYIEKEFQCLCVASLGDGRISYYSSLIITRKYLLLLLW
jgi:hypothetical protein